MGHKDESIMCTLYILRYDRGTSPAKSENTMPVALAVVELHLAEKRHQLGTSRPECMLKILTLNY